MEEEGTDHKNKFHTKPRILTSTITYHTVTASQSDRALKHRDLGLYIATKIRLSLAFLHL